MSETAEFTGQHAGQEPMQLVDYQEHWDTTAVTPLPDGWVNVFVPNQLDEPIRATPAPALLTQTRVCAVAVYRHDACGDFTVDVERDPVTRVVFAAVAAGQLIPASDYDPEYVETVPVERYSELAATRDRMIAQHFPSNLVGRNGSEPA